MNKFKEFYNKNKKVINIVLGVTGVAATAYIFHKIVSDIEYVPAPPYANVSEIDGFKHALEECLERDDVRISFAEDLGLPNKMTVDQIIENIYCLNECGVSTLEHLKELGYTDTEVFHF